MNNLLINKYFLLFVNLLENQSILTNGPQQIIIEYIIFWPWSKINRNQIPDLDVEPEKKNK